MTEQEKNSAQVEQDEVPAEDDGTMSLTAHLEELRSRLIKSLLAVAFGSCVAYLFLDRITNLLTLPVGKLYYMKPGEAFFTYLKIDIAAGCLIALPIIFYHAWRFFFARTHEKRTRRFGNTCALVGRVVLRRIGVFVFFDIAFRAEIFYGLRRGI